MPVRRKKMIDTVTMLWFLAFFFSGYYDRRENRQRGNEK
jgi:hypothetical protein